MALPPGVNIPGPLDEIADVVDGVRDAISGSDDTPSPGAPAAESTINIPGPIDDVAGAVRRIDNFLTLINPLNWPGLLTGAKQDTFSDLLDMMLEPDTAILSTDAYMTFLQMFAAVGTVLWVIEIVYRFVMMAKGEPGHGREAAISTAWIWGLVPSLPAIIIAAQGYALLLGMTFARAFLDGQDPRQALLQIVSTEGLNPFLQGVVTFIQFFLILFIGLELVGTILLMPICGLLLIIAFGTRWMGDRGDAIYRAATGATLLALGTTTLMVVWFSMVLALGNLVFPNDLFARAMANLFALIGAAIAFWPFKKWFDVKVRPKLRRPDGNRMEGGNIDASGANIATSEEAASRHLEEVQTEAERPSTTSVVPADPDVLAQLAGIEAAVYSLAPLLENGLDSHHGTSSDEPTGPDAPAKSAEPDRDEPALASSLGSSPLSSKPTTSEGR